VLTLTYFGTYFSFYLILHYRFRTIVNRVWAYHIAIDMSLLAIVSLVNLSYLVVTVIVDFCTSINGLASSSCIDILSNKTVLSIFQSSEIILSMLAVVTNFILATILLICLVSLPRFQKILNEPGRGREFRERYRDKAQDLFFAWSIVFVCAVASVLIQRILYSDVDQRHGFQILGNTTQLFNTV
jgi:hypothetical protein